MTIFQRKMHSCHGRRHDVVMTLLVPAESVNTHVVIALLMT